MSAHGDDYMDIQLTPAMVDEYNEAMMLDEIREKIKQYGEAVASRSALAATGEGGAVVPVEVTAQDVIDADDVFATSDGTAQQAADIINARLRDRAPNTVECPTCGRVSFGSHVLATPAPDVAGVVWDGEAAVWEFVGYLSVQESLPPTRQDAYAWQDVAREFLALRTAPPAAGGAQ